MAEISDVKKILITGASGFVGSYLVEEALKRGMEVYAGIRRTSNKKYLNDKRIHFFEMNLSDKEVLKAQLNELKAEIGNFNYIIHNAGLTKTCNKKNFDKVNYLYTRNFIEALFETANLPDKFIYISSLAAFGPGKEGTNIPIKVSDTPKPVSYYGKSKLKAELFIKSLPKFPFLIFRPTGVYGPREKDYYVLYKSINTGLETYIGSYKQNISFIYVKDLSRLILDALKSSITGKAYFVSDLKHYTAQEFNKIVKHELNKKTIRIIFAKQFIKYVAFINEKISCFFGKVPSLNSEKFKEISCSNWLCDSSQIIEDFDFKPEYDLTKGIHETIKWYKKEKLL